MANRILVLWPSGNVLCEGESSLASVPAASTEDRSPSTEPCPPTKRSRGNDDPSDDGESGIFRRAEGGEGGERGETAA